MLEAYCHYKVRCPDCLNMEIRMHICGQTLVDAKFWLVYVHKDKLNTKKLEYDLQKESFQVLGILISTKISVHTHTQSGHLKITL